MTKTEIQKAAQADSEATASLVAAFQGATEDAMLTLIERLIAAARRDEADDIHHDLKAEGYRDAAEMIESNYLT